MMDFEETTLNICGRNHEVKEITSAENLDNVGQIIWKTQKIKITKDMNVSGKFYTMVHEAMHGMLFYSGVYDYLKSLGMENDEFVTMALGTAVADFMCNNFDFTLKVK